MDAPIKGHQSKRKRVQRFALLPDEVLMEILSWVPPMDVNRHCRLVCTRWRDVADSPSLWVMLCQRKGYLPKEWSHHPKNWKKYYYICSQRRNLVKNPSAEENFKSWQIERNGGDKWKVEDLPGEHGQLLPDPAVTKYFVTSYGLCLKSQLLDLRRAGYSEELLDQEQPPITIRDWYAARADCGCRYELKVQLLCKEKKVLQTFSPTPVTIPQWSDAVWSEVSYTFSDYGPGVRYVKFRHGGVDTQFWAGWYGVRVTNSSVTIEPEDLTVAVK